MNLTAKHRQFITLFFICLLATSLLIFVAPTQAEAEEANDSFETYKNSKEFQEYQEFQASKEYKESQEYREYKANEAYLSGKAKSTGFEFDVGLGYLAVILGGGWSYDDDSEWHILHAINLTLSVGYRWDWVGIYFDQTLGGIFLLGPLTSTTVNARFFYQITDNLELWGQAGMGAAFIWIFPHLAFKFAGGLSYKVSEKMFIGGDLSYLLGVNMFEITSGTINYPSLSFHLRFLF